MINYLATLFLRLADRPDRPDSSIVEYVFLYFHITLCVIYL